MNKIIKKLKHLELYIINLIYLNSFDIFIFYKSSKF